MQIIRVNVSNPPQLPNCVATMGNFDGLHVGHQALIEQAAELARVKQLQLILLSFEPYAKEFFNPSGGDIRLMRLSEKLHCLKKYPIDYYAICQFNQLIADLSAEAFVTEILFKQLKAKAVVVGNDFRFAKNRSADIKDLTQLGYRYEIDTITIPMIKQADDTVSSSKVRKLLCSHNVTTARRLLGRNYSLMGRVIYGDQRGRTWGIPTANISLKRKTAPLTGIYVVRVIKVSKPLLEVHILEFNQDIYGERLFVDFLSFLREEENFTQVDDLIVQIKKDIIAGKQWLIKHDYL